MRFQILALICAVLLFETGSAWSQVPCDVPPYPCESGTVEPTLPKFDFKIEIKPSVKVKSKVQTKPRKAQKQTVRKVIRTKKVVVAKPRPRPSIQAPTSPKLKKSIEPKPQIDEASWVGLPEIPVSTLLARDLADIEGQYIVDLSPTALTAAGVDIQTIGLAELAVRFGVAPNQIRSVQRRFMLTAILNVSAAEAQALASNPLIAEIAADTQIKAAATKLKLSWGLDRLDSPTLPLDRTFDRTEGDYNARVYLFDTAVDLSSREFSNRITNGAKFVAPPANETIKCREHGTEMASLLAGQNTGAAPKAEIIELVVLPCERQRTGEGASVIEATEWLLQREAELKDDKPILANMSLIGKWSKPINKAISVLSQNGVVVVAAAGNNAQDACRFSPASAKQAITVAATDPKDEVAGFSNFGSCVDIFAPGRLLTALTVGEKDQYVTINGTSGAAAMVTGILARSLHRRGGGAAQEWLATSSLPGNLWNKSNAGGPMIQANASWRSLCRVASETKVYEKQDIKSSVLRKLSTGSLIEVATINGWIKVIFNKRITGWLSSDTQLLKADQDILCEVK